MKYKDATSFRQALERRIANEAQGNQDLTRWRRQSVAFDRIIARLVTSSPDAFYLKGGLALQYRFGEAARYTVDMDLAAARSDGIRDVMHAVASIEMGDFFELQIASEPSVPFIEEQGIAAYQWAIDVVLDGRRFERVFIDIGVGDASYSDDVQVLSTQPILEFADVAPVAIRAISLERHIAEKLHAYVHSYGDAKNTRVKDLVDLALLSSMNLSLNPEALRAAIDVTFSARGTSEIPSELPSPPERWRKRFAEISKDLAIPSDISVAHQHAAKMIGVALRTVRPFGRIRGKDSN